MMFMCGVDTFGITEQIQSDGRSVVCASKVYNKAQITTWGTKIKDYRDKDVGIMEGFEGRDTDL